MSADIETPASPEAPATVTTTASSGKQKTRRGKRGEFPTYVPGKSCIQLGKKHDFVTRPSGSKICRRCGSSVSKQTIERAKSTKGKKSRKQKSNNGSANISEN